MESLQFSAYCQSIHASENLLFMRDLRALQAEKRISDRKIKKLYDTYFNPEGPLFINVSSASMVVLHARFGPPSAAIFQKAEAHILSNLCNDLIPRFMTSEYRQTRPTSLPLNAISTSLSFSAGSAARKIRPEGAASKK
jgi:hypothetical protein